MVALNEDSIQSIIPIFRLDDPIGSSTLPKHDLQIPSDALRPLPRRKMTSALMLTLIHHIPQQSPPGLRQPNNLLREVCEALCERKFLRNHTTLQRFSEGDSRNTYQLHPWHIRVHCSRKRKRPPRRLIINPQARGRPGSTKPIQAHPGTNLLLAPWITIRPIVKLLIHPR